MGRGRAKAKQAKVARDLKYRTPDTDLDALQREMHAEQAGEDTDVDEHDEWPDYAEYSESEAGRN